MLNFMLSNSFGKLELCGPRQKPDPKQAKAPCNYEGQGNVSVTQSSTYLLDSFEN